MKIALRFLATAGLLSLGVVLSVTAYAQSDTMGAILEKLTARIQRLENSCGEDIKKFCSTVTPGGGRIVYCMQAYEDKISPKCAFELDECKQIFKRSSTSSRRPCAPVRATSQNCAGRRRLAKAVLRHVSPQTKRQLRRHVSRPSRNSKSSDIAVCAVCEQPD